MFEKVKNIIVDKLNIDESTVITMDTNLIDDLNADSLDAFDIIVEIEEEFDITVDEDVVENIKTVGDIINYLEEHAS